MKKQKWLWILDPWDTLDHPQDTSLRLIQAALDQKIECSLCTATDLALSNQNLMVQSQKVLKTGKDRVRSEIQLSPHSPLPLSSFSKIHYRIDPPVDLAYLQPLQLLHFEANRLRSKKKSAPEFINPLSVLLFENEKIAGMRFKQSPRTLIASRHSDILSFTQRLKGKAILKPLHMAQSRDIHAIQLGPTRQFPPETHALIQRLTEQETRPVVIQEFLEKIHEGETRLWFCDSKLIATARKVPHPSSFKIDMDHGSTLQPHILTATEKKTANEVSKLLKKQKIRLAAVDLIDSKVTDYNFTSPGLLVGLEKLLNQDLATRIITTLKKK